MQGDLTADELKLLKVLASYQLGVGADEIARRLGYRPARSGRLAVTTRIRSLNRAHPADPPNEWHNDGKFIGRIPPKDRWGHAVWFATKEGKEQADRSPSPTEGDADA